MVAAAELCISIWLTTGLFHCYARQDRPLEESMYVFEVISHWPQTQELVPVKPHPRTSTDHYPANQEVTDLVSSYTMGIARHCHSTVQTIA
ncbi:hypothetical protein F5B20DRAFT_535213 [Whalleya microplaca]|nr:hypothetical protein F5B20DRAFT_535213 [Whalleya microplaca]